MHKPLVSWGLDIISQMKAQSRSAQRPPVAIDKDRLVRNPRLALEKRCQQFRRLGPNRAEPLFATFSHQANVGWGFQPNSLRAQIQSLLDSSASVIKEC